jgi:hypothetical protein
LPDPRRYGRFFQAFAELTEERLESTPATLVFLRHLIESSPPAERRLIVRTALEVFHYTIAWPEAPAFFARIHAAGHLVDIEAYRKGLEDIAETMEEEVERLLENPSLLSKAAAPEIWFRNRTFLVTLPILGIEECPLVFDLNTAPIEFFLTVPGMDYQQASRIVENRQAKGGFRSIDDIAALDVLKPEVLAELEKGLGTHQDPDR